MNKTARASFIFATMFLDSLGIGILIPILPDVIRRFSSDTAFISTYYGYFMAVYALMQFVASPVLGSLSDRFGRRPILLMSLLGGGLDYVIMAFAPNLTILFIGRVISGLTGASFTVASAYIADVSDDSNRSKNFGMIGAAFGFGFIVGPAIGGFAGSFSPVAPFLAAAALNLLNFAFGLFVLPESLPSESRRKVQTRHLNPLLSLKKIFTPSPILGMVFVYTLLYLAGNVHPSVWALYTEEKFGWTPAQIGISLAIVGVCGAVIQGGLTGPIMKKLGEPKALFWGNFISILAYIGYAVANKGWIMYAILIPASFGGVTFPALQSLISRNVPPSEQGELQGSLVGLASFTAVIAPILYTTLFAHFAKEDAEFRFSGMPYLVAGLFCVVSTLIALKSMRSGSVKATT